MFTMNATLDIAPVEIRELYRQRRNSPDVYGSIFDLTTPFETRSPDGRRLRVIGIEVKEIGDDTFLGHLFVNWALKSGEFSQVRYAVGMTLDSDSEKIIESAFQQALKYLDGNQ